MNKIEFLSIREYAKLTNQSKETVRNLCNQGNPLQYDYISVKVDTTWVLYRFI